MPTKELYDDIIKPPGLGDLDGSRDSDGEFIISDFKWQNNSPHVQLKSKQRRYFCECEILF